VIIQNSEEFVVNEFDAKEVIVGETLMTWNAFSYVQRQRFTNQVQRNKVIAHDSFLNFGQSQSFKFYSTIAT
jgi:hypothetical protein